MADASEDQEKTEPATARRLEKAREEGQVARSRELTTFLLMGAGLLGLSMLGASLADGFGAVMQRAFLFDHTQAFDTRASLATVFVLGRHGLFAVTPILLLLTVVALGAPLALGGWAISSKALAPQWSRLNPLKGLKRMASGQMWAELGKAIAKSLLVGGVGAAYLLDRRSALLALTDEPARAGIADLAHLVFTACGLMVLALLAAVAIDVPWQLWSHAKQLRMSKEEVRRESKETDGDPQVKGRIRSQQQAIARGRMMGKVPEADVIVTNPTHFAVALRYDESRMRAPRVVAKGAGEIAARIRALGREHGVPVLEAPPLARALYRHVDLDREIPGELYTAVAEVLVWAMRLQRARAARSAPPPRPVDLEVPAGMDDAAWAGEDAT